MPAPRTIHGAVVLAVRGGETGPRHGT